MILTAPNEERGTKNEEQNPTLSYLILTEIMEMLNINDIQTINFVTL